MNKKILIGVAIVAVGLALYTVTRPEVDEQARQDAINEALKFENPGCSTPAAIGASGPVDARHDETGATYTFVNTCDVPPGWTRL